MANPSKTQEKSKSAKLKRTKKRNNRISYDKFLSMPRSRHYFPNDNPREYTNFSGRIRAFIIEKLNQRPYGEQELFRALNAYNPSLMTALDYMLGQVEEEFSNYHEDFKKAIDLITDGIEVRFRGNRSYWGLSSKLDSA
ncbi:MAG: hypothetical protein Q8L27_04890 [archaeon]|nr:hypothetical protein [archaeon]